MVEGMGTYPQGSLGLASPLIPTLAFLLLLCRALNLPLMGEASMGKGTGEGEQAGFLGGGRSLWLSSCCWWQRLGG